MYIPNFIEIGQTFCGRTYGRADVPTDGRIFPPLMLLGPLGGVDLMIQQGAEPVQCCVYEITRWGANWHHLENAIKPTVCGADAALYQITFITYYYYHTVLLQLYKN